MEKNRCFNEERRRINKIANDPSFLISFFRRFGFNFSIPENRTNEADSRQTK
jgi:hypothetical protein